MISFSVTAKSHIPPESLCEKIFNASQWSSFKGFGPIPGIEHVVKTPGEGSELGTIFHVKNLDGSSHDEKVTEYIPSKYIAMHMYNFSSPLDKLASHFTEHWRFHSEQDSTVITRSMELYGKNFPGSVLLRIIALFLKKALKTHTELLASGQ